MSLLQYYPTIEEATRRYPSVNETYHTLISICNGTKRRSGRLVIDHAIGTAERVAGYLADPLYINAALLHDVMEDHDFSVADVKAIPRSDQIGEACAQVVSLLSKPSDINDKHLRDQAYMKQLWSGIIETRDKKAAIIKLCDRIDNLRDPEYLPSGRIHFYLSQSILFYYPIALKMNLPNLGRLLVQSAMRHLPDTRKEV
ncbi:MAG: HD domain-containing protein [Deltaproteobacteria bacterium]|nr:HD domain-containing protein [Deltaproteobacteria bacterium]